MLFHAFDSPKLFSVLGVSSLSFGLISICDAFANWKEADVSLDIKDYNRVTGTYLAVYARRGGTYEQRRIVRSVRSTWTFTISLVVIGFLLVPVYQFAPGGRISTLIFGLISILGALLIIASWLVRRRYINEFIDASYGENKPPIGQSVRFKR